MTPNKCKIASINRLLIVGLIFFVFMNFVDSKILNGHFLDTINLVLGRDFINFYHYGIAAWEENPAKYYDVKYYDVVLNNFFGGHDYTFQQWSYPPHYMLVAAPFAFFNYYISLAIFTLISLFVYWKFIINTFDDASYQAAFWLTPILVLFAICGQLSAIIAVLFVIIFNLMDKRPVLAGLLIALLTVKPQVGLLFPLFLIITGRWKVFLAASIGTLLFIGSSIVIHGVQPWITFIEVGAPAQSQVLINLPEITAGLMPTAFVNLYNAGMSFYAATIIHTIVAICAIIIMIYACKRTNDEFLKYAIFITCTFLLTPYLMMYDILILVWVTLTMATRYQMSKLNTLNYICLMLLPIIGISLSLLHIPGSFLVIVGIAIWISKKALNAPAKILAKSEKISLA